ncbi:WhiB family transcriptional regulator [Arthrobacter sp. JSM 101049]|uniref:WhiB family transcriptional regulator n=1 Tax=Arthrobacter sp. JSM 101049 TaxID=929097 RepID=UPI0035621F50
MLARPRARRLVESPERASQAIDWRELAECRGWTEKGVDPWFPQNLSDPTAYDVAARICACCPVAQQCLDAAMAVEGAIHGRQRSGMFGGLTPEQRYALYRRRGRERSQDKDVA